MAKEKSIILFEKELSVNSNGGSANAYKFKIEVIENSTNSDNNTSNVTINHYGLTRAGFGGYAGFSGPLSIIKVGGVEKARAQVSAMQNTSYKLLSTWTGDIAHNADGNLTINVEAQYTNTTTSYLPKTNTLSGSVALTYIPRQATLTGASNFNDEQNPVINYSNPAGNAVTSLQACISWSGGAIEYRDIPKTGTSYTFPFTIAEINSLYDASPNSSSMLVNFNLKTVIGNQTYYSALQRTFTIVNANPFFTDFSYKDTNSKVTEITGNNQILIANKSSLLVSVSSSQKMLTLKSATGSHYSIEVDGANRIMNFSGDNTVSSDCGTLRNAGSKRINVRAFDSRNNSTLVYKDITVIPYSNPNIYITAERLNKFEESTTISCKGSYSKVNINGEDKNVISDIKYRIRETCGDWGDLTPMTFTIDNEKGEYTCEDVYVNLDNKKSFEIEVQVSDAFDTYNSKNVVGIGKPIFFISDNLRCVGVNCIPPSNAKPGSVWFDNGDGVIKEILDYEIVDEY